jgi:transposase-like protein
MNFAELAPVFANENNAIKMVESIMWPNGTVCPHCGGMERAYDLSKTRLGLWKCGHCRKQFTVKVGTIFEDSKIPLSKWLTVIYMMCSAKKGVSATQVQRSIGVSYKSAWFMCHRIRLAMTKGPLKGMLGGPGKQVEVDETYVGGKPGNNKHRNRKPKKKIVVMTLIDRQGEARTFHVEDTKKSTVLSVVRPNIHGYSVILTDDNSLYDDLHKHFWQHKTVRHKKTFVRGIVHTNFAESYHSLLKRSIIGTHHHISEKHLSRYLREREFHWNRRKATDGERTFDVHQWRNGPEADVSDAS